MPAKKSAANDKPEKKKTTAKKSSKSSKTAKKTTTSKSKSTAKPKSTAAKTKAPAAKAASKTKATASNVTNTESKPERPYPDQGEFNLTKGALIGAMILLGISVGFNIAAMNDEEVQDSKEVAEIKAVLMDAESAEVDPNNPQQAQQISRVFHEGQIWIRLFPADDSYNAEDVVVLDNGVWSQIQNPIPADGIKVVTDSTCAICPPADQLQQAIFSSIPFIAAETASEIPVIDASTDEVPSGLGQIPSFVFTDAVKVNSIFNEEFFASFPEVEGGVAVDPGTLGLPINAKIVIDQNQLPAEVPTEPELTIVEYSDFTCSFCARFASQTKPKILEKYGDQVVIDYRHMARGPGSYPPAIAAECVKQVGTEEQFWQFHDLAFADISDLSTETLTAHAETAGVPLAEFTSCVANEETRAIVEADTAEAQRLGVTGTPGFYIDNIFIGGALPFESFDPLIASKLAE